MLQTVKHPNIIKFHEFFKEYNKFCIVMEFAENGKIY